MEAERAVRQGWTWSTVLLTAAAFGTTIALAPPAGASPTRALTWLLFVGSSVHVAATAWLYTFADVRAHALAHPRRYVWAPLGLVAVTSVSAALLAPSTLAWPLLAYFAWQFAHFQKQNLGLAALAASAARVRAPSALERRALMTAGSAGIAGVLADPGLLQKSAGFGVAAAFPIAGAVYAGAAGIGALALLSRPRSARPAGFGLVYVGGLLFFAPVFVFNSPYAAVGALTVAHGLQYLLLVGLVAGGVERGSARVLRIAHSWAPRCPAEPRSARRPICTVRRRSGGFCSAPTSVQRWPISSSMPASGDCATHSPGSGCRRGSPTSSHRPSRRGMSRLPIDR